ncbi:hypothetical protein R84B8_02826 [Treponema sp. R8-4-B8]
MPTKTPVKKTVKKAVKKAPKKVTWDDIEEDLKEIEKLQKETWEAIREIHKDIFGPNEAFNSLVEYVKSWDMLIKFNQLGFTFDRIISYKIAKDVHAEIDAVIDNITQAMIIEVMSTLEIEDINDHIKRMEKVRKYADDHGDKREFLGAIAAMVMKPKPRDYALNQGFFLIEPSGDDVKVIKPEGKPKVW